MSNPKRQPFGIAIYAAFLECQCFQNESLVCLHSDLVILGYHKDPLRKLAQQNRTAALKPRFLTSDEL
jgi:hypothetical protein